TAALTANATPSGGTYSWVPAMGLNNPNISNPVASPNSSSTYTVYYTDSNGCIDSKTVFVTVNILPILSSIGNTIICPGQSATLFASVINGVAPYSYYWSPSNTLNNANVQNPIASPIVATTYTVTVTDANECTANTSGTVNIGIKPTGTFTWTPTLSCEGVSVQFNSSGSQNVVSSYWDFGDGTNSSQQNPEHVFPYNSTYYVTLIVTNPPCHDSIVDTMRVGDVNSFIAIAPANVFTPNGDGMNDCFHLVVTGIASDLLQQCITMEVYDRWGIKVFESTQDKNCWDGRTPHKKEAIAGTYYYIAKFGQAEPIHGFVELLR
ncbi:MAG: gliding motility-associated C-terminal domain-containing protein, partial [Bacteroidota bacterium]